MDRVNHYWLDEYHVDGFDSISQRDLVITLIIMITVEFNC